MNQDLSTTLRNINNIFNLKVLEKSAFFTIREMSIREGSTYLQYM